MRQKIVAANWKMNASKQTADALLKQIIPAADNSPHRVIICPPFPYLSQLKTAIGTSAVKAGAQNVNTEKQGAFTGEVSAEMLLDFGVEYVIVGHSERRTLYGESNVLVAEKAAAAISAGLTPIICVGETLQERQNNQLEAVVEKQLGAVIDKLGIEQLAGVIIAYEPLWAIGTGKTASTEQAQAMHMFIRSKLAEQDADIAGNISILYGGSVNDQNAQTLFACNDIDGGLIGGASLNAASFIKICHS